MNNYLYIFLLVLGVLFFLLIIIWLIFNIMCKSSFKKLDGHLKRRHVLSIEFLSLIYDCFLQEQSAMIKINEINGKLKNKVSVDEYFDLNIKLGDELQRIYNSILNYPELKSKENFNNVYNELLELSKLIDTTRFKYNKNGILYNKLIRKFPYKIFNMKNKIIYVTKFDRFENNF